MYFTRQAKKLSRQHLTRLGIPTNQQMIQSQPCISQHGPVNLREQSLWPDALILNTQCIIHKDWLCKVWTPFCNISPRQTLIIATKHWIDTLSIPMWILVALSVPSHTMLVNKKGLLVLKSRILIIFPYIMHWVTLAEIYQECQHLCNVFLLNVLDPSEFQEVHWLMLIDIWATSCLKVPKGL